MIFAAVVILLTLTVFLPSSSAGSIQLLTDPTRLTIFSLYFAQYVVTTSTAHRDTYRSKLLRKREVDPTQNFDLNISSDEMTSMEPFRVPSTAPDQLMVGDLEIQLPNSSTQSVPLTINYHRKRASRKRPFFVPKAQDYKKDMQEDDFATETASMENTSNSSRLMTKHQPNTTEQSQAVLSSEDTIVETGLKTVPYTLKQSFTIIQLPLQHVAPDFKRELNLASSRIRRLNEKNFAMVVPADTTNVEAGFINRTYTERIVHAPVGTRLVISCSVEMYAEDGLFRFNWTRGKRGSRRVKYSERINHGRQRELIIDRVKRTDAGIYICKELVNQTMFKNQIDLHVFSVADLAVEIPFVFRAAHCSKTESSLMLNQINDILIRRFGLYRFILAESCSTDAWYNQKPDENYPSLLRMLAVKRTKVDFKVPKCDMRCVMRSKLKDILSDIAEIAHTLVEVGLRVGVDENCLTEDCGATYVFQPNETVTGVRVVYVCDAGQILYGTSACEPCFPGTYSSSDGLNEVCTECPARHYQREAGAVSCVPCFNMSHASLVVTGADDTYACRSRVVFSSYVKDVKDALSAVILLLFVVVVGVVITAIIAYFMWCRNRRKMSKAAMPNGVIGREEMQPLRPKRSKTATGGYVSIKTDPLRTAPQRPSTSANYTTASSPTSQPAISNRTASPTTERKETDQKALGSASMTTQQGTTAPHASQVIVGTNTGNNNNAGRAAGYKPSSDTSSSTAGGSASRKFSTVVVGGQTMNRNHEPIAGFPGDLLRKSASPRTEVVDETFENQLLRANNNASAPGSMYYAPAGRQDGSTATSIGPNPAKASPQVTYTQPRMSNRWVTTDNEIPKHYYHPSAYYVLATGATHKTYLVISPSPGFSGPTDTPNTYSSVVLQPISASHSAPLGQTPVTQATSDQSHAPSVPLLMQSAFQPLLTQAVLQPQKGQFLPIMTPSHFHPSPFQPSPFQPSLIRPSPIRPSPIQPSPIQPSLIRPSSFKLYPIQPSPIQPSSIKPSPFHPSHIQPSPIQPSPIQPPRFQPTPIQQSFCQPPPKQISATPYLTKPNSPSVQSPPVRSFPQPQATTSSANAPSSSNRTSLTQAAPEPSKGAMSVARAQSDYTQPSFTTAQNPPPVTLPQSPTQTLPSLGRTSHIYVPPHLVPVALDKPPVTTPPLRITAPSLQMPSKQDYDSPMQTTSPCVKGGTPSHQNKTEPASSLPMVQSSHTPTAESVHSMQPSQAQKPFNRSQPHTSTGLSSGLQQSHIMQPFNQPQTQTPSSLRAQPPQTQQPFDQIQPQTQTEHSSTRVQPV